MNLLTRQTDYAVRALGYMMRRPENNATAAELTAALKIPRPFLRKLLQELTKHHVLRSRKGAGGGFELARDPEKIRFSELIEIFQGPLRLNHCTFRKKPCPNKKVCAMRRRIGCIEEMVINQLRATKLTDLVQKGE
ncbi:MAG TPA: Rrf2 family transcriptional regulator [bacterium]|nr:Rrf2 family transcriptional regulator [bacterium]